MAHDFHVLVVDDEQEVLDAATEQLERFPNVVLRTAASKDAAIETLRRHFHNIAFVDLQLHGSFEAGRDVLQALSEQAPTCERIILTGNARKEPNHVLPLMSPFERLADGLIPKTPSIPWFAPLVGDRLEKSVANQVRVEGLAPLVQSILEQVRRFGMSGDRSEADVEAELHWLFQEIFHGMSGVNDETNVKIQLSKIHQGLSAARVIEALPHLGSDALGRTVLGNRCVVKLGRRKAVEHEIESFRSFVRFGVALDSRVELLGTATADNLAAACYSFAGGNDEAADSLDGVVTLNGDQAGFTQEGAASAINVVDRLFDDSSKRWYDVVGPASEVGLYFEKELRSKFDERIDLISRWARSIAAESGGQYDQARSTLRVGDNVISVPDLKSIALGATQRPLPTCLVHGDLHGGNILLTKSGRLCLIDFAHSGFGPRAIDPAVLHGSVRLWDTHDFPGEDSWTDRFAWLSARAQSEQSRAIALLEGAPVVSGAAPPWRQVADRIDQRTLLCFDDMEAIELLTTCQLQAVRLMTLPVGTEGLLRILCWYDGLHRAFLARKKKA